MERETVVLCGANSYEQKYYFNRDFAKLPEGIQQELQVMCVLFTEDVGGVLTLEFSPEGVLEFKVQDKDEEKELHDTVEAALDQIDRQKYESMLTAKGVPEGKIREYGFAFLGKKVLIGGR